MPITTNFQAGSSAERVWEAVLADAKARGKSETELLRDVDVGFTEDPQLQPRSYNQRGAVEAAEVFEYAYARPVFYPILAREKIPIPFSFVDFDPTTLYDDQLWHEISIWDHNTAAQISRRFASHTNDYRRTLAKAIFDDSITRFPKTGDCEVEKTAAEAARAHCGACTEATNQLYARYQAAGLQPKFLFFHNWEPSLNWLDLTRSTTGAQDHVLLAIPMQNGGLMQVDPINRWFDAQFSTALQITPRQYATAWLGNRSGNLAQHNKFDSATADIEKSLEIAPRSTIPLILGFEIYTGKRDWDEADLLLDQLDAMIPNDPATFFLRYFLLSQRRDGLRSYWEDQAKAVNAQIPAMVAKHPGTSSRFLYLIAASHLEAVKKYVQTTQSPVAGDTTPEEIRTAVQVALDNFYKSLKANPRYPFAVTGLLELTEVTKAWKEGIAVFEQLLNDHPRHPVFIHAAARCNFRLWQATGRSDEALLKHAWDHIDYLTSAVASDNPRGYILASEIMVARQEGNEALALLRRGLPLWKDHTPWPEYFAALLNSLIQFSTNTDELRQVMQIGLKTYGEKFALELSKSIYDSVWFTAKGTPSTGEVTRALRHKANHVATIDDALSAYPATYPQLDGLRTAEAFFLDMAGEVTAAQAAVQKIHNPSRQEVLHKLDYFFSGLKEWLYKSRITDPGLVQRLENYLDHVAGHTPPLARARLAEVYTLCAAQYVGLGLEEAAVKSWQKAVDRDVAASVDLAVAMYQKTKSPRERVAFLEVMSAQKNRYSSSVRWWLEGNTANQAMPAGPSAAPPPISPPGR